MEGEMMSEDENSQFDMSEGESNISVMEDMIFTNEAMVGTPLAEVFSIVLNIESEIYGTIRVEDNYGSFFIYCVEREDSWCTKPNENLILSHETTRAICAEGSFTLFFNLKDKKRADADLISGECCPEINHLSGKHMVVNVEGNFNSLAIVEYTVFHAAVEANIRAEFYSEHPAAARSSPGIDVEGTIVASFKYRNGLIAHQIKLFDVGVSELRDNKLIPLDRPVVVLPVNCIISIVVNLKVANKATWKFEKDFFPDDIICQTGYYMQGGEYGVVKIACDGYRYINSLQTVEWMKKLRREKENFV